MVWIPAAVGDSTGAVFRLQRPVGDWGQVHAGAPASNAAEAASHDNFLPGDAGADDVAVIRVTDVVRAAAAVKIDVEGSEAAAMRSCGSLLLDPALQLAAIEFQGSSDAEYVAPFPHIVFVTSLQIQRGRLCAAAATRLERLHFPRRILQVTQHRRVASLFCCLFRSHSPSQHPTP